MASVKLSIFSSSLDSWSNRLLLGLITLYGGYSIINGRMTLGSFTAVMLYINQLLGLQSALINFFAERFISGAVSIGRFSQILESWPEEREDKKNKAHRILRILLQEPRIENADIEHGS